MACFFAGHFFYSLLRKWSLNSDIFPIFAKNTVVYHDKNERNNLTLL
jgi:hypothetical protein